nr:YibE/F family protein [Solirubrobacterales bacterium]
MGKAPSHSISSRIALVALGLLTLATVAGLVALWPSGDPDVQIATEIAEAEEAEVVATTASPCQNPAEQGCEQLTIELRSGVDEGQQGVIVLGQVGAPELGVGDRIRVTRNEGLSLPGDGSAEPSPSYSLTEVERSAPMLWLAAIFAALVIVLGRWRGARSLVGLAISLALVTFFIIPAILDERSPLLVALV